MYKIQYTNRFKKDYSLCKKRGLNIELLKEAISILGATGTLPPQYKLHPLKGKFQGFVECHIQSNWLLVWQQNDKELILLFTNTGTHADLFK
jgi:mRNA interferase YafQ